MTTQRWFFPALILTALAAASIGFGASHVWDRSAMQRLEAERNTALDCRHAGAGVPPCPVIYKNTKIEWRDKFETVQTPDRKQAERIGSLTADLARARRTIHALERARTAARALRATAAYTIQNGSMEHPYNTSNRCPTESVVLYDAGLSSGNTTRRSGDPNVCYVRARLHNNGQLALYSGRR
jgi:hypothetical protein